MIPIKGIIAIQVRMAVRQAQAALAGLKGNLTALQTSIGQVGTASSMMNFAQAKAAKQANTLGNRIKASGIAAMKSASQFQWFSRQLMYNWGIPLIAAGTLATKWALETEAAMTKVAKVYGDLRMDPDQKKRELDSLAKYFEAVSNRYGMLQKDVIQIGADWAAAGAQAVGLAKATRLTIETMILGEMNAEEATKSLISIQEAWRVNAAGLQNTIAQLNIVENQTAVSMQGLIEGFIRTGSAARIAGLTTGDLAALIAGLVPAAGNATVAGNSLKTILSRIAAPTKAAERAIGALGFNIDSTSWRSKGARQRLEEMAESFSKLDRNQKQAIATDIAGRQQYNRFVQVMDALADRNSAYWTAQKALEDGKKKINGQTMLQIQYEKELNQVLTSNPQAMKIVIAQLQNLAIKGIAPLIPYIIAVMQYLVKFAQWLGNLPPEVKKLLAALTLLILGLTVFSKMIAAFRLLVPAAKILFGTLLNGVSTVGAVFAGLGRIIISPFKLFGIFTSKLRATQIAAATAGRGIYGSFAVAMLGLRSSIGKFLSWLGPAFNKILVYVSAGAVAMAPRVAAGMAALFGIMNRGLVGMGLLAMNWGPRLAVFISKGFPAAVAAMGRGIGVGVAAMAAVFNRGLVSMAFALKYWRPRLITALGGLFPAILGMAKRGISGIVLLFTRLGPAIGSGLMRLGPAIVAGISTGFKAIWPMLLRFGPVLIRFLTGPWGLAISAIVSVIIAFRDQLGQVLANVINFFTQAWNGVTGQTSGVAGFFSKFTQFLVNCFYALPKEIQRAMQAVVDIVYKAAMAVYQLFSYLNPFARHSPSLVENVVNGMQVVKDTFAQIVDIKTPIARAYADVKKFKDLMASFRNGKQVDLEFADNLKAISKVNPGALKTAKSMISDIKSLQKILDRLSVELTAQQQVVDAWSAKLDDANYALKEQQDILDSLSDTVDYYQSLIDDAQDSIDRYASASITGMQAADDAIQSNTQAQNELKLAMMQMEQASGGFDTVADRLAALNGEFEQLSSSRDELIKAGAGSDILAYYDQQIDAIQNQKNALYDTADAYTQMSQQLSDLEKQGDLLDLTKSVNFDPLTYQIEKLSKSQEEMSYDDIINGITNAQSAIKDYTPDLEAATAAMKDQEAVVYALTQQRDAIQRAYDAESAKLDKIKAKYDAVSDAISALKDALNDMSNAASSASKSLSKKSLKGSGVSGGAGVGGYPGGGGVGGGKSFGIKDLEKGSFADIDKLTQGLQDTIDKLDFMKPIREKWEQVVQWWNSNIQPAVDLIWNSLVKWFGSLDFSKLLGGDNSWLASWWDGIVKWWNGVVSNVSFGIDLAQKIFGDDFQDAWDNLVGGIQDFIKNVGPGFMDFWESVKPFIDAIGKVLGDIISVILPILGIILVAIGKALLWVWNSAIRPLLSGIGSLLGGLFKMLGGVMDIISGIFTGNADLIKRGFEKIFGGLWDSVVAIFKTLATIVWNLIGGLFTEIWQTISTFFPDLGKSIEGFWNFLLNMPVIGDFFKWIVGLFQWLYDVLVGHSIIPDLVKSIVGWFTNLVGWAAKPIMDFAKGVIGAISWVYDTIKNSPIGQAIGGIVKGIQDAAGGIWKALTSPFSTANDDIQRSFTEIDSTVTTGTSDITSQFTGSSWQGLDKTINQPFSDASSITDKTFDDMFKNFKGYGKDFNKTAKTDWKKIRQTLKSELDKMPKDQKQAGKKITDQFLKTAKEIQKQNPKLWEAIKKSITEPTEDAADSVEKAAKDMKSAMNGLNGVKIPTNWKNLGNTIPAPTNTAAKKVKSDISSMNRSIDGLDGGLPREWRNLRSTIVDPVRDAKSALSKIRFSTSNITAPLGRIASAADRVTYALSRMIGKWSQAESRLGLRYGGAVSVERLNGYASSLSGANGMATGGAVHGAGGPTSDSILRYLSSGEHVFTAREVARLGGQGSVYALRGFIRRNNVSASELIKAYKNSIPGHANGGSVVAIGSAATSISASMRRMESATVSRNGSSEGGNRTFVFKDAHFEFPNVKNGTDAKEFLDNLEALIG